MFLILVMVKENLNHLMNQNLLHHIQESIFLQNYVKVYLINIKFY